MTMQVKILLTGLAGGVALFFWGFLAHAVLPLGTVGMKYLGSGEDAVIDTLRQHIKEPGLYPFPFMDPNEDPAAGQKRAEEKTRSGPHGLLIVEPKGGEMMTPDMLIIEFVTNVVTSLLAAFLLSQATCLTSFPSRVGFTALIGLTAAIMINVPHWNWYKFPGAFTVAEVFEHVVGLTLVGIIAALIMKPKVTSEPAKAETAA